MSQVADFSVANGSGLQVRSGLNAVSDAIVSKSSGSVAPTDLQAYMSWFDTSGANAIWNIRNGANSAWIQLAEEIGSNLRLSSDGASIPSVGAANTFTADQKIRLAAALGQLLLGGQVTSGIASRLAMIGNNSGAAETIYAKLEADIETNSAGNESGRLLASLIRGGSQQEILRLGDGVQIGSPTGGLKGLGTLNLAGGLYINNVDILTTIAAASAASWETSTHTTSPQDMNLASNRNYDLTFSAGDITLNFDNPTSQIGRFGLIRLNNTSGGDRTITFSNANSVEIGGGFTTDGTKVVSTGAEVFLLYIVKSATLVYLFEFVGETVVSGNGFSSFVQWDLTTGEAADPLQRLQAISDGETQRVVIHELTMNASGERRALIRASDGVAVHAPGSGTYKGTSDIGGSAGSDAGIAIGQLGETADKLFGELLIRRTNSTLWVKGLTTRLEYGASGGDANGVWETAGLFFGDTITHWVPAFVSSVQPASGSKFTVFRDVA